MRRIEVIREVDRLDEMLLELGNHVAYGDAMSEELALEVERYGDPTEALAELQERRFQLAELLRRNPGREEFDV